MTKRMLLSVDRDEARAAVVEDGQIVHIEIEPNNRNTCKGNIYRSTVARVEPSLQSAFVEFGNEKQGFLPVGEIHPKLRNGNPDKRAPIQELIRAKQDLLVQVSRDEIGQKGATLSTYISLPGRYLVLIPESDQDKAGVSRKLSDEARDRIKKLTDTMKVPDGFGLIVRTAGETATETELAKDLLYLTRQWEHITRRYDEAKGPTLLYAERSLAVRFVRDYFTKDIEEIVIDDDETLHEVKEFLGVLMPRSLAHVHRYAGDVPMFARYGIEGKVEDVFARQVFLPGGGSIVIDQTEAMVAIDVNSGRVKEKDIEETARTTNIEAAQEIARQLMLRDLGGLVVIDFIDMREKKYVREVEQALKDAFKNDKARTKLGHISEFGLLELSRQRIKSSVNKGTFDSCPHCSGTGRIRSFESVALAVLRRIYEAVAQRRIRYVIATVPAASARYLLNARRSELAGLERQYHLTIEVIGVDFMPATQVMIECLEHEPAESGAERSDQARMVRVHQELDLVRNSLVKREETRLQIEAAVARRGARVDYQEIYKEVREMAPPEPPVAGRREPRSVQSEPPAEPQALAVSEAAIAPQRGFKSWFLGLFGLGAPATASQAAAEAAAADPVPDPQPAAAPEGRGRRDRYRSDRNGSGERGPNQDRPAGAERPSSGDRNASADRAANGERSEASQERADRADRPDRADRSERGERAERSERGDRPERGERWERQRDRRGDGPRATGPRSEGPRAEAKANGASNGTSPPAAAVAEAPANARPTEGELPVAPQASAPVAPAASAADQSEPGRRRRRRRRRGGDRSDAPVDAMGMEGNDDGDDDGDESAAEAQADDATQAAAEAEAAQTDGADPAPVEASEAAAEAPSASAPAQPEEHAAAPSEPAAEAEPVEAVPAVDAKALMQQEIAALLAETASAEAAPPPAAEPAKAAANKRFVIDLRTPR